MRKKILRSVQIMSLMAMLFGAVACQTESSDHEPAPYLFVLDLSPLDTMDDVDPDISLRWRVESNCAFSSTLFWGEKAEPEHVVSVPKGDTAFAVGPLKPGTRYYWKAEVYGESATDSSFVHMFTTAQRDRKLWSQVAVNSIPSSVPPLLHEHRLYVNNTVLHEIRCYDGGSGQVLWTRDTVRESNGSTDELCAGSGRIVYSDDQIRCLSAQDGTLQWTGDELASGLCVSGNRVFGTYKTMLKCYDLLSGEPLWRYGEENSRKFLHTLSPFGATQVTCLENDTGSETIYQRLIMIDALSGKLLKAVDLGASYDSHACAFSPTHVFVKRDCQLRAYLLADGSLAWTRETPGSCVGTPLYVDGTVFFNDSDNRHTLVKAENGEILWSLDNPSHECNGSGVIEQNGILYITYTDGYLAAVDVKSGERLWKYFINCTDSGMVLDGDRAYVFADRYLHGIRADF